MRLTVFHAGSLTGPLQELTAQFRRLYPKTSFLCEVGGSVECVRKVVEEGRKADIIISADYYVFHRLMLPAHTTWYLNFARNRMVIIYTEKSVNNKEINAENWPDILLEPESRLGRTCADKDPAGYRTLMVWQLAEKHYGIKGLFNRFNEKCRPPMVFSSSRELLSAVKEGAVDYAFEYVSVARQNGFAWVDLPPSLDLSAEEYAFFYQEARVPVCGREQQGMAIINSLTIPRIAPNPQEAARFCAFLTGAEGRAVLSSHGLEPLNPPQLHGKLPPGITFLQLR